MALRYWVGGTAAWDATAGTKWATTSGGAGGAAVPTTADQVFLDANSGTGTCAIQTAVATPGSIDCTGYSGTLSQATNINMGSATLGDFILSPTMTFVWISGAIKMSTTKAGNTTLDLKGLTVGTITINAAGATILFAGDVNCGTFGPSGGNVDMNGFNLNCLNLSNGNTTTRTVFVRSGTITMRGTGSVFDAPAGVLTYNYAAGAKFVISDTSATTKTFAGGTGSYPEIDVAGTAGALTFSGAFTTAKLKIAAGANVKLTAGTTLTSTAPIDWNGAAGNLATISSTSAGSAATISVPSGTAVCDYLSLKDIAAVGGATFYAGAHSTNVSGNSGWTFTGPPSTYTRGLMLA